MHDILARGWTHLLARLDGPMHFRFIVQPLVAMFLGARAGLRDARAGEPPFLSAVVRYPGRRSERVTGALRDVASCCSSRPSWTPRTSSWSTAASSCSSW